jgi:hypothetical protein
MENTFDRVEPLFEKIEDYGRTSFELYKLKTIKKTAEVVSTFVLYGLILLALLVCILFSSIALALWLGELLGSGYIGFLCVGGLYLVLGGVFYFLLHKFIQRKISNSIIIQLLN